ncbi:MAG: RNA methyltransferase [Turicibacter sp.]|nr:RNA methyltransferase [Turicibacter sp.]
MITSKDNSKYKLWLKLSQKKHRLAEQLFLVEGEHLVNEAATAGVIDTLLVCEGVAFEADADAAITYLARPLFEKLASTVTTAGVMAVCRMWESHMKAHNRLLLVDDVQDPGNLGTLIRSALAFGFDGVVLSEDTVDLYNDKVVRATQGALFYLPIHRTNLTTYITQLQQAGTTVYATALTDDAKPMAEIPKQTSLAFVVGNEGAGVNKDLIAVCDGSVIIAMTEAVESLNVGVAGSILMHHFNDIG